MKGDIVMSHKEIQRVRVMEQVMSGKRCGWRIVMSETTPPFSP
jgi:hypothetical protein